MWSKSIAVAALVASVNSAATYPSNIDEIEDLLFLQNGYRSKGFTDIVSTCDQEAYAGFNNAAGLIRTGFHDVAAHANGKDGLDASIGFELSGEYSDKNAGPSFYADMVYFAQYFNSKASMADLLALGVVSAVKVCGGPDIALRAGRIDATSGAAEPQLPDPGESIEKLTGRFSLMGFSPQEMIQLVACGHTIGAVHKGVSGGLDPTSVDSINDAGSKGQFQFDSTPASFDNAVAKEFCSPEKNGLPFGDSIDQLVRDTGRDSDTKIFQADKPDGAQFGLTIQSMADSNDAFLAQCQVVLEKMINLVPSSVSLSDVIQPYDVKPSQVDLNVQPDGSIGVFAEIRVRDGAVNGGVSNIQLVYTGKDGQGEIQQVGETKSAQGKGESFTFYSFSGSVSSISKFSVSINGNLFDNNGQGFPVDDSAFIQTASSTTNNGQINLVVAVRGNGQPSITVTEKQGLDNGKLKFNTLPTLKKSSPSLSRSCRGSKFSFFTASFTVSDANTAKIDLSLGGQIIDSFRNVLFGSSAASFSCSDITSSSSTTVSSTTSSVSSSSTTSEATTTSSGSSSSSGSSTSSSESSTGSSSSSDASSSTTSSDTTSSSAEATSTTSSEGASTTSGASSVSGSSSSESGTASAVTTTTTKSASSLTTTSKAGSTTTTKVSSLTSSSGSQSSSATGSGTKSNTGSGSASTKTSATGGSSSNSGASTKSSTSGKPSSSTKEGNPWQQWTQAASSTTSKSAPVVTPTVIVPQKPNKGAFADAIAEIVDKLNKNPAKGVNEPGHEQNVPGIDLHVKIPKVKPTVTVTTQVYTQTVVYVTWNSAPTATGQGKPANGQGPSNGQPTGYNGASSWAAASSWIASQQSGAPAAPANTLQTWVASATPTGTSPVKSFTGSASSINAGGFLFTAVCVLAAAILL